MTPLQDLATVAGALTSAGLAVAAFIRAGRSTRRVAAHHDAEVGAQVQQRYEEERQELMRGLKAMYEQQIQWLRAQHEEQIQGLKQRIQALEAKLREHGLL